MSDPIRTYQQADSGAGNRAPAASERRQASDARKKRNFFVNIVIQCLKWLLIIILGVALVVTIVVITVNQLNTRSTIRGNRVTLSEQFTAEVPILEWYSGIDEIRGSTADAINRTFIVVPHIGYDQSDRAVQTELVARTIQIRELISFYFASRATNELHGVENRQRVKSDLTMQINRIMTSGKIRDVAFDTYQLLEF